MHKVENGQELKVITLQVAVPADAEPGAVADEISALMSECGTCNPDSNILDWGYVGDVDGFDVKASDDYEEGEFLQYEEQ